MVVSLNGLLYEWFALRMLDGVAKCGADFLECGFEDGECVIKFSTFDDKRGAELNHIPLRHLKAQSVVEAVIEHRFGFIVRALFAG